MQTTGSIITQFQAISQSETEKQDSYQVANLLHTLLARNHIAHTTKLVDLVVA